MGTIEVLAKWDLKKNSWNRNPSIYERGRSFAFANYEKVINNPGGIDYIIIGHGSRVEDHSTDYYDINERKVRIDNVISYFGKLNGNYDIRLFLMDADAPIIEDAKLMAEYVERLASLPTTNSVNIIGLSKCSDMNFYVPSYFRRVDTLKKVNIYNVAAPYNGTKLASPAIFYPEVKTLLTSKFGDGKFSTLIYDKLIEFYENISSNSHMDYDIAMVGGISDSKRDFYDEGFIRNIFSSDNVEAIKKINSFNNFVTGIDSSTLREAILTMNFVGIGLCVLDELFFDNKSDGMVYSDSQRLVDSVVGTKSIYLPTHHDVNNNIRAINEVLGIVDDTIEEYRYKCRTRNY